MAVADVIAGPITLWKSPVAEAVPDDDVIAGAAWGGNWVEVGYTEAPLSSNYDFVELELKSEQELAVMKRRKSAESLVMETVLLELTASKLAIVTSGTANTTAAAAAQVGKDELLVGGEYQIDEAQWGFEGTFTDSSGNSFPVRAFVWKATAKLNAAQEYSSTAWVGIPIQIKALVDTSKAVGQKLWKWQRVTAAATG